MLEARGPILQLGKLRLRIQAASGGGLGRMTTQSYVTWGPEPPPCTQGTAGSQVFVPLCKGLTAGSTRMSGPGVCALPWEATARSLPAS